MTEQSLASSLPIFYGKNEEDIDFYIKQFNSIANLEKWTPEKRLIIFKLNLGDKALEYLINDSATSQCNTIEALQELLIAKFRKTKSFSDIQSTFSKISHKPGQSVRELAEEISRQASLYVGINSTSNRELIDLAENIKLTKFLEVLRSDIRLEVKKTGPKDFKSALKCAINVENALEESVSCATSNNSWDFQINTLMRSQMENNKLISKLTSQLSELTNNRDSQVNNFQLRGENSRQFQSHSNFPNPPISCHICQKNHLTTDCWFFPSSGQNFNRGRGSQSNRGRNFRGRYTHPYRNNRGNFGIRGAWIKPKQNSCSQTGTHYYREQAKMEKIKSTSEKINTPTEEVKEFVLSCNTSAENSLPIIQLKFGSLIVDALIDSGASLSLIEPNIVTKVKESTKVEYVSRSVKIVTLNKSSIPYMSAVKMKFKIETKWFENLFYVTKTTWNSEYQIILGYDFLQRNRVILDSVNKQLIVGYSHFSFKLTNNVNDSENIEINTLSLSEVRKLRKEEIKESDFDLEHLDHTQRRDILDILMRNTEVFSKSYLTLGSTNEVVPEIKLLHNFSLQTKPYPIPKIAKEFAQQEVPKLLEAEIIQESSSSYAFPAIFIRKKTNKNDDPEKLKFRMVIDYRLLNCITESFKICLPSIIEIMHCISGHQFYRVLDLKSAFFQIQLKESDREKLAFWYGTREF
ncbi:uncharacterized protein LOC129231710 [Uloborus diversus]|uniref:uncharacterized protein LOC129231710 n=1 Tax=Uloborus diversus TaxID=327109 RepID=UPI002409FE96|nr:uncharacterized protein LOC129231710 [Uloborus diversus]